MHIILPARSLPRLAEARPPPPVPPPVLRRLAAPLLAALVAAFPATGRAGPMTGAGEAAAPAMGDDIASALSRAVDAGIEASVLGSAARDSRDLAIGADLAFAVFNDPLRAWDEPIGDGEGRTFRRLRGHRDPRWPFVAHPIFELHLGGLVATNRERGQIRASIGSGAGVVGLGLCGAVEFSDAGRALAVGPELRLRHRFGPGERSQSIGLVLRADLFVHHRAEHADRLTFGVVGLFDAF